jgi:hypothetical protein
MPCFVMTRLPGKVATPFPRLATWDFDRIIVGHGTPIESGGKEKLWSTLRAAGVKSL